MYTVADLRPLSLKLQTRRLVRCRRTVEAGKPGVLLQVSKVNEQTNERMDLCFSLSNVSNVSV